MSWGAVGDMVVKAGAVLTALAVIVRLVVRPVLIRPIGRIAKAELREVVEEIITGLFASVLREFGAQTQRIDTLSADLRQLADKLRFHLEEHAAFATVAGHAHPGASHPDVPARSGGLGHGRPLAAEPPDTAGTA